MLHLGHSFVWCRKLRPRKVDQKCTYQHEAITSRSRQLLMMGTWLPETCWEKSRREIKNTKVTSSWFFLSTLNFQLGRVLTLWRLKTPIVDYRTANLQSCILYIYSTNTVTEYFKHGVYSHFSSSKCSLFHNSNIFGSCIIHILYTGCAKIKKKK